MNGAHNVVRPLATSGRSIDAKIVHRPKNYPIDGRTVVVNPNLTPAFAGESPGDRIPAFSSTILTGTRVEEAESVLLFQVNPEIGTADGTDRAAGATGVSGIVDEPGWSMLGDLLAEAGGDGAGAGDPGPGLPFPRECPLWRGPQDDIGLMEFDPALALGRPASPGGARTFRVKVNLWFAPAGTDCFIHDRHDFIEIHSQIYGFGRMQKFTAQDHSALYEDLLMSPGQTTPTPFCRMGPGGTFVYPWHQYRADTDCVWLAVEYHAVTP
ncbi:hypothetical protein [Sphaerisporangium aureirubrum]|uniref:Uncharacterized protein n=1 Tax=Sphaerisporangium aureirubrum TaxID=1544736 RepID=A0ABW1NWN4_9ACTN